MDALTLLTQDHRDQERMLEELLDAFGEDVSKRQNCYDVFKAELVKHINIEEELFYPRIKEIKGLEVKVLEALEEHNICMRLLQELDLTEADEAIWKSKIKVLKELTHHHINDEEEELFPQVKELASAEYLRDMGQQMRFHKSKTDPDKVLYPDS
ncbi:MAG TPA: hemerythrin domain-containing protein [Bacteriovoracaceae bacterium]|nr:hemerythrin domain-containing protein [Bacteriovoracaceae bacterium]